MDQENKIEKNHHLSEALVQLNTLMHEATLEPSYLEANLRAFVSIYVRVNSLSEDVFIAFCEYEVIQKLFGPEGKQIGIMGILQMFNLILANTNQTNTLVYIFSQPIVHEFLFSKFDVSCQNSQTVQYYVQLLKTIIMKISNGQASLIKMFCNNRYCSFPLLTQVSYLATQSREELVRVTAQQCVLLLIQLLNSKQIGRGYLAEIQMAVFYHQLTQLVASQSCDVQGYLKYIADLMVALQGNTLSLCMLANAFCINVIITLLGNLPLLLKILRTLSAILAEQEGLSTSLFHQIKLIFGKILSKYCFNQFLNGTYLYSLKYKKSQSEKVSYNQLSKYFRVRFEHLHHFLNDIENYSDDQYNTHGVVSGWREFNRNRDLRELKLNEDKRTGIFRFFQAKPDPLESYVKMVLAANGMNYDTINKIFLFKLEKSIHSGSSVFFIEKILLHQGVANPKEIAQAEVHFNDNRGNFDFTLPFCQEVLSMLASLEKPQISINAEVQREQLKDLQFEHIFLRRLKLYLINNLSDFILRTDREYSAAEMCQIRKVLRKLQLWRHLQKKTVQKMLWKMQQLQTDINELTFMRDFKLLIQYVLHSYSDKLYNVEGQLPAHLEDPICSNMLKYQFISQILDPSRPSIQQFIEHQWGAFIEDKSNLSKLSFAQQTKDYLISIVPKYNMKFEINIKDHLAKDILKVDIKQPQSLESILQKQKKLGWEWSGKEMAEQDQKLMQLQVFGVCSQREEVITKWIVQYFQMTYNRLCSFLAKKHQKAMIVDSF